MKPVAPLMIEHRTVERMLGLLEREKRKMAETGRPDYAFIEKVADFFETFVDAFHHGKEEKVLFELLSAKPLSSEHRELMEQLIAEHAHSRDALSKFREIWYGHRTEKELLESASHLFEKCLKWYPVHIEKEDRHFFLPAMDYLSTQEQEAMTEQFVDFGRNFVKERYGGMLAALESRPD